MNQIPIEIKVILYIAIGFIGIAGLLAYNQEPCQFKAGDIVHRKLDGVKGVVVSDMACHGSGYQMRFADRPNELQDTLETELTE